MKLGLLGLSVVLGAALAACGGADQNTTNSGGSGGAGASNTGGSTAGAGGTGHTGHAGGGNTGGGNTGGGNTGGGNTGGGSTGGGSTGGAGGGNNLNGPCGGFIGEDCAPTQYCNYDADTCGNADGAGTCEDKPSSCPGEYAPVCACDGNAYSNACEAAAAGFDLSTLTACPAPPDTFPCGSSFCGVDTEYCQIDVSDIPGTPNVSMCVPLPGNCILNGIDCACLADLPCADKCEVTEGGLTITCPGG